MPKLEKRSKIVGVRLTPRQYAMIARAAKRANSSVSLWLATVGASVATPMVARPVGEKQEGI